MSTKAAKLIFWIGTLSSLALFLALTYDTTSQFAALTHADKLDNQVVSGKRAFEQHNCNDCHTILGFGAYYAPDLTRVYYRIGEDGIRYRLQKPEVAFANDYRKMPQQHIPEQEINDIIAYLKWVSNIENNDWPPQDSKSHWKSTTERVLASATMSPGAALIQQEGCLACHSLGEQGENMGPRFEWIGGRHNASWIADYIADPQKVTPGTKMPAFPNLTPGQRQMIADFVSALAAEERR